MSQRCLVLFDADRIKDYVFASGRLREIRGASEQVRRLTDAKYLEPRYGRWNPGTGNGEGVIYAGGGAGAILVDGEKRAEDICRELEKDFRTGTGGATLSAVWVPVGDEQEPAHAESKAQDRAARLLARRKESRPHAESLAGGAVRFCSSDRLYPASATVDEPGTNAELHVSRATAIKWKQNRASRQSLIESDFWHRFNNKLPEGSDAAEWERAVNPSQDLGSIGAQSTPSGYVALVYADGDRVGKTIQKIVQDKGFLGYQQISQALTNAATEATASALASAYGGHPPPDQRDPVTGDVGRSLPFDVITIGGDDILLLCTAGSGLRIACDLGRFFASAIKQELTDAQITVKPPMTASVGVVIAHDSMPILTLERAGRELLKSAKDSATPGAIDFHVVSTPGLERLGTIRAREYQIDERTKLTKRPYALTDAQALVHHARVFRGLGMNGPGEATATVVSNLAPIPNTKIADLYRACRGDRNLATLEVLGIHSQLTPSQRRTLTEALKDLGSIAHYPFSAPDEHRQVATALIDLLEASEFVSE